MPITVPAKDQFQPDADAIAAWLGTRKPNLNVGGTANPGLLSDLGNSGDARWVALATFLELVGLFAMIWGGISNGGTYLAVTTLVAIAFVVLDYVLAKSFHAWEAQRCLCRAWLPFFDQDMLKQNQLKALIAQGKWPQRLIGVAICVIAVLKFGGVFLLGVFSSPIVYFVFFAFYALVAHIHIKNTGYWWAYVSAESQIKKQFERMTDAYKAQPGAEHVTTPEPLVLPIKLTHYEVTPLPNAINSYSIAGRGILSDDDMKEICFNQTNHNRVALFRACRKLQFSHVTINGMPTIQFPEEVPAVHAQQEGR